MQDKWKHRREGFLVALLVCVSASVAYGWHQASRGIDLTDEQLRILIKEKFVPVEVVREITNLVEVPKEIERIITERVEVEVPGAPVEVVREIQVPAECPDPLQNFQLGGGCEVIFAGQVPDRYVQGWWRATATGEGWEASRGPVLSTQVRAELVEAAAPPRWSRMCRPT